MIRPLAITFLLTSAISFAIAMLYTRPTSSSKSPRRRLGSIQDSAGPHAAGTIGAELERAEDLDFSAQLGALLGRYRFTERLKVLLVHSDSSLGIGGAVLFSVGLALVCGLLVALAAFALVLVRRERREVGSLPIHRRVQI